MSGRFEITSESTIGPSGTRAHDVRTASSDAFPHTPHEDDTYELRWSLEASNGAPSDSSTVTTLYSCSGGPDAQYETFATSPRARSIPSVKRKPTASSKSFPGVRIVTAIRCSAPRW